MAIRAKGSTEVKSLGSIRSSGVHSSERHVHQFQIAALELERSRRKQERKAALGRVANLDARLAEVDTLIRKHQEALGPVSTAPASKSAAPVMPAMPVMPAGARPSPQDEKRRTLRY